MNNIPEEIKKIEKQLSDILPEIPIIMGNEAVNFAKGNFRAQAFRGESLDRWKSRKSGKSTRAILVQSGALRRSVRVMSSTRDSVTVGSSLPYAKIHNDGFSGTVQVREHSRRNYTKVRKKYKGRNYTMTKTGDSHVVAAHTRQVNMPQRQFLGSSPVLTDSIISTLEKKIGSKIS